jgi:hypothetical protein
LPIFCRGIAVFRPPGGSAPEFTFANPGDLDFGRDLGDLISAKGDNIFMLKATYRFNL